MARWLLHLTQWYTCTTIAGNLILRLRILRDSLIKTSDPCPFTPFGENQPHVPFPTWLRSLWGPHPRKSHIGTICQSELTTPAIDLFDFNDL